MKAKTSNPEWLNAISDYFTFSRTHRKGALFLLCINILLCSGYYFIYFLKPPESYDPSSYQKEIAMLEASIQQAEQQKNKHVYRQIDTLYPSPAITISAASLFPFDPNTLDKKGFTCLGLSSKQADVLLHYRSKGGYFRKKEDLKKMYCLKEKDYLRLEPFIEIHSDTTKKSWPVPHELTKQNLTCMPPVFDLNTIGVADLDSIRGIGPAIANAIVSYREKLGGFNNLDQLHEVYGLDSILYVRIAPQLRIGNVFLNKININKGFADELKHPYLDRGLARLIVNYRKLHGPFGSVDDLKKLALVNEELYLKLAPYLTTQ